MIAQQKLVTKVTTILDLIRVRPLKKQDPGPTIKCGSDTTFIILVFIFYW